MRRVIAAAALAVVLGTACSSGASIPDNVKREVDQDWSQQSVSEKVTICQALDESSDPDSAGYKGAVRVAKFQFHISDEQAQAVIDYIIEEKC